MRRAIIFAHYDKHGIVDDHVFFLVSALANNAEALVFVSTSASDEEIERVSKICHVALRRENIGYDFLSWKLGVTVLQDLDYYDEILFVNDSIYGPLSDLKKLFNKTDKLKADFWGLTRSHEVSPHIQSFFFSFRRNLISNGVFQEFWSSICVEDSKSEVIEKYEIGMTRFVESRGAQIGFLFDPTDMHFIDLFFSGLIHGRRKDKTLFKTWRRYMKSSKKYNPMHFYWKTVIRNHVPFVKVELLRDNPCGMDVGVLSAFFNKQSHYDGALIKNHIDRIKNKD